MENLICMDSSVLISHYIDRNKFNSFFYKLLQQYDRCILSIIAEFEILIGATAIQKHHPLATLDSKHICKIDSLLIITPFSLV